MKTIKVDIVVDINMQQENALFRIKCKLISWNIENDLTVINRKDNSKRTHIMHAKQV